jgi:hypothetical protein
MGSAKKVGSSVLGGAKNILKGKEVTYKRDPLAGNINMQAKKGLNSFISPASAELRKIYANPQQAINNQIGLENKLMRGASEDAARKTQELIAQRGMGTSSIGLGQEIGAHKQLSEKMAINNASYNDRFKDLQNERMQTGMNLFGLKTAQGPIQMQNINTRKGGMAQLIGTVGGAAAGGMMGGPQGAQTGAQVGSAVGGYYQNS